MCQAWELGLYIVRTIVEDVYHGSVDAQCNDKPISRFNIPLIKPYIYQPFEGKDEDLVKQLRDELVQLESAGSYDAVVAYEPEMQHTDRGSQKIPRYHPDDLAIRNEIKKPTFKVTIRVEMPPLKGVEVAK